MQGANLEQAQLQGAKLGGAQLQGASLRQAQFQGASLHATSLQGASLNEAQLQGALLEGAQLQGADLEQAKLQGASLRQAQFQGASLYATSLQGASLNEAQLQGANLKQAQLQGANLNQAQLQGASLDRVVLHGASLVGAEVWRARVGSIHDMPLIMATELGGLERRPMFDRNSYKEFETWRNDLLIKIPEGSNRDGAAERLAALDPSSEKPEYGWTESFWNKAQAEQLSGVKYRAALAGVLENIACDATAAPYVARELIGRSMDWKFLGDDTYFPESEFTELRLYVIGLDHLIDIGARLTAAARAKPGVETDCPGARGLSEDDLKRLNALITVAKSGH